MTMDDSQTRIQSTLGEKYEIKSLIQSGGMGKIFLGVHKALNKKVAIKIIHQELVKNESIRGRFHREAKLAASLDHSGIIDIYDFGSSEDFDYIIMPFIDGENLQEKLKKHGAMDSAEGIHVMVEIAEALYYAHSHNVVHRDIKPSNIMFDHQNKIVIADFGISKDMGDTDMTAPNTVLGSPKYMSPEQIRGVGVDARSDLYSLGLVFYEMLTGDHPYKGRDTTAVYYAQAHEIPPRPETLRPEVPRALGGIIMKLLEKNPENRYADGAALLKDLRDYQSGKLAETGDDDATLIDDATLVDDATIVDPVGTPVVSPKPDNESADLPDSTVLPVAPSAPAAESSKPGVLWRRGKILAGAGIGILILVLGLALMFGGSPDENPPGPKVTAKPEPATQPTAPETPAPSPDVAASSAAPSGPAETSPAVTPTESTDGPKPSLIDAIAAVSNGKTATAFSLWTDRDTYRIGDTMSFYFKSGQPGYAVVLAYTTKKDLVQIFPNHYMTSQFVQADREYVIPGKDMGFDLQVFGPAGEETLIAIVGDGPFALFDAPFTTDQPFLSFNEADAAPAAQFLNRLAALKGRDIAQQRLAYRITD
jgi:serine/threonine-protein kinase